MKRIFAMQHLALSILAIGLVAGLSGCSLFSEDFDEITVANAMDEPLYFLGVEKELSHRMDINLKIPMDEMASDDGIRYLEPGTSAMLQKEDVMGEYDADKTLRLFLYVVRSDTAHYMTSLDFTYQTLKQSDFRIEVSDAIITDPRIFPRPKS